MQRGRAGARGRSRGGKGRAGGRGRAGLRGKSKDDEPTEPQPPPFEFSKDRIVMMRQMSRMMAEARAAEYVETDRDRRRKAHKKALAQAHAERLLMDEEEVLTRRYDAHAARRAAVAAEQRREDGRRRAQTERMEREVDERIEGRTDPGSWLVPQVRAWVSKIDSGETELHAAWYAARFEELGVDGGRLLHAVDTRFLIDTVGMDRLRPRLAFLRKHAKLKQAEAEFLAGFDPAVGAHMGDDVTPAVRRRRSRMAQDRADDVTLCSQMYSENAWDEAVEIVLPMPWLEIVRRGLLPSLASLCSNARRGQTQCQLVAKLVHTVCGDVFDADSGARTMRVNAGADPQFHDVPEGGGVAAALVEARTSRSGGMGGTRVGIIAMLGSLSCCRAPVAKEQIATAFAVLAHGPYAVQRQFVADGGIEAIAKLLALRPSTDVSSDTHQMLLLQASSALSALSAARSLWPMACLRGTGSAVARVLHTHEQPGGHAPQGMGEEMEERVAITFANLSCCAEYLPRLNIWGNSGRAGDGNSDMKGKEDNTRDNSESAGESDGEEGGEEDSVESIDWPCPNPPGIGSCRARLLADGALLALARIHSRQREREKMSAAAHRRIITHQMCGAALCNLCDVSDPSLHGQMLEGGVGLHDNEVMVTDSQGAVQARVAMAKLLPKSPSTSTPAPISEQSSAETNADLKAGLEKGMVLPLLLSLGAVGRDEDNPAEYKRRCDPLLLEQVTVSLHRLAAHACYRPRLVAGGAVDELRAVLAARHSHQKSDLAAVMRKGRGRGQQRLSGRDAGTDDLYSGNSKQGRVISPRHVRLAEEALRQLTWHPADVYRWDCADLIEREWRAYAARVASARQRGASMIQRVWRGWSPAPLQGLRSVAIDAVIFACTEPLRLRRTGGVSCTSWMRENVALPLSQSRCRAAAQTLANFLLRHTHGATARRAMRRVLPTLLQLCTGTDADYGADPFLSPLDTPIDTEGPLESRVAPLLRDTCARVLALLSRERSTSCAIWLLDTGCLQTLRDLTICSNLDRQRDVACTLRQLSWHRDTSVRTALAKAAPTMAALLLLVVPSAQNVARAHAAKDPSLARSNVAACKASARASAMAVASAADASLAAAAASLATDVAAEVSAAEAEEQKILAEHAREQVKRQRQALQRFREQCARTADPKQRLELVKQRFDGGHCSVGVAQYDAMLVVRTQLQNLQQGASAVREAGAKLSLGAAAALRNNFNGDGTAVATQVLERRQRVEAHLCVARDEAASRAARAQGEVEDAIEADCAGTLLQLVSAPCGEAGRLHLLHADIIIAIDHLADSRSYRTRHQCAAALHELVGDGEGEGEGEDAVAGKDEGSDDLSSFDAAYAAADAAAARERVASRAAGRGAAVALALLLTKCREVQNRREKVLAAESDAKATFAKANSALAQATANHTNAVRADEEMAAAAAQAQAEAKDSTKAGAKDPAKAGAKDRAKAGAKDRAKAGEKDPVKAGGTEMAHAMPEEEGSARTQRFARLLLVAKSDAAKANDTLAQAIAVRQREQRDNEDEFSMCARTRALCSRALLSLVVHGCEHVVPFLLSLARWRNHELDDTDKLTADHARVEVEDDDAQLQRACVDDRTDPFLRARRTADPGSGRGRFVAMPGAATASLLPAEAQRRPTSPRDAWRTCASCLEQATAQLAASASHCGSRLRALAIGKQVLPVLRVLASTARKDETTQRMVACALRDVAHAMCLGRAEARGGNNSDNVLESWIAGETLGTVCAFQSPERLCEDIKANLAAALRSVSATRAGADAVASGGGVSLLAQYLNVRGGQE